jgi:hypothetical protein
MSIKVGNEVRVLAQNALEGATGTVQRIYGEAIGGGLNKGPLKTREYAIVSLPGYAGDRHIPTALLEVVR